MSNAWRDDNFFGQPWVRVAGPLAVTLYQAAEDYCHRELSGAFISETDLRLLLPWPLRPGELDAAIAILERCDRLVREEEGFVLPRYAVEQEDDDAQASRTAQAKRAANTRWEKEKTRRAGRKRKPKDAQPMPPASESCSEHQSSMPADASVPPSVPPSAPSFASVPHIVAPSAATNGAELAVREGPKSGHALVAELLDKAAAVAETDTVKRVWSYYAIRFAVESECAPDQQQHYFVQLARLVKHHAIEGIVKRINTYFDRPPWKLREGSRDFGRFLANFDQLAQNDGGERVVRKIQFEDAGREWCEHANGAAARLAPEIFKFINPPKYEAPF